MERLNSLLRQELARREVEHQLRRRRAVQLCGPAHLSWAGRSFVNFASNDYLGLAHHSRTVEAQCAALDAWGVGAGASAMVSGFTIEHERTEAAIASWKGVEAAILLPSGYQAAHAVIQTLAGVGRFHPAGVRFLVDKLAHASLIDAIWGEGLAGSRRGIERSAAMRTFPHNDMNRLRQLLASADANQLQVVVTESVFSMDGDAADLRTLAQLKSELPFVLVLDEAHASGVYGEAGAGYASELGFGAAVDVSIVTFSKAAGMVGGAACASHTFCEAMENWARAYIYSTAVPPATASGIRESIQIMRDEPWRQQRVRELAAFVRTRLNDAGLAIPAGDSPIIPVILQTEQRTMDASSQLMEKGFLVGAIRPPTVPRGSSRLRISLSSEHTDADVQQLLDAVIGLNARD